MCEGWEGEGANEIINQDKIFQRDTEKEKKRERRREIEIVDSRGNKERNSSGTLGQK